MVLLDESTASSDGVLVVFCLIFSAWEVLGLGKDFFFFFFWCYCEGLVGVSNGEALGRAGGTESPAKIYSPHFSCALLQALGRFSFGLSDLTQAE